jgi:carboxyl-terminal processing protease
MSLFNKKNLFVLFSVIAVFASSVLISFWFGNLIGWKKGNQIGWDRGVASCKVCKPEDLDFSLFWEAWKELKDNFYDPQKFDIQKMIYGAISGMVNSLNDPYTVFFNPTEVKEFLEDTEGVFEGIGAEIDKKKGELLIVAPLEGTPAQKAGLRPGDKILKIDDTITADLTIDEAVKLIRGPQGSIVTLTILREGWDQSQEFKIVRSVITVPSLKWEVKTAPNGEKIAYIKLYQFSGQASSDFYKAAIEILKNPVKKIILDLRDNPGGYLEVAQDIAGWFLKNGSVLAIEDFGEGKEKTEFKTLGNENFLDYPIVVLINHGSASGSEILAGALRDNRGIKLIGETSFGKGLIQELRDLRDGSSLKITIAKWLTPNGQSIIDKGLEPDIKVEMTEKDYEEERDPQLDKALEVIQEMR